MALLDVQELRTWFHTRNGVVRAVDGVSFSLEPGETLGIVGESGSGKSVAVYSLLGLIPMPPGRIEGGSARFDGTNLLACTRSELRAIRGGRISMIFQDPMTALNPYMKIGPQLMEPLLVHTRCARRVARERAIEALEAVGIRDASERMNAYPHQFSGGMRQRVMIAMALITKPALLIADEPTTALDVTIQAQILDLLRRLQEDLGMSILFITHDLGVVAEFASDVVVMYAGRVVETGSVEQIFADPLHPYTRGLLASVPPMDSSQDAGKPRRLPTIDGVVPDLAKLPAGCRFADRCALYASGPDGAERCTNEEPELSRVAEDRSVRCHFAKGAN